VRGLGTKSNKPAVLAEGSASEPETPSGKDLGCGDSGRDHNAGNCPREDKFPQGSAGTKRTQLDEDGELGRSSRDSNHGKRHNKGMGCDLRKKREPPEETADEYPSEILEEYFNEETTAGPPDVTPKLTYDEALTSNSVVTEKKEDDDTTGEPMDATRRPHCDETATEQGSTTDQLEKTMTDYPMEILEEYFNMPTESMDKTLALTCDQAVNESIGIMTKRDDDARNRKSATNPKERQEYKEPQYPFRNDEHLDDEESNTLLNLPDNPYNGRERPTSTDDRDQGGGHDIARNDTEPGRTNGRRDELDKMNRREDHPTSGEMKPRTDGRWRRKMKEAITTNPTTLPGETQRPHGTKRSSDEKERRSNVINSLSQIASRPTAIQPGAKRGKNGY
ncbi:13463_t:CDS:2, partial [Acaulospora morrowiae]